ncbi:MAG: hypothetical protein Q7S35_13800 [Candidatus Limnocylindrales bacterium]|nr:hypothetical protein [Candidatus Limnocylindrales bacterium]
MKPKTIVRATTHPSETRPNIPTAELETIDPLTLVEELRAESEGRQTEQLRAYRDTIDARGIARYSTDIVRTT